MSTREVQTGPCPRCHSFDTTATIAHDGTVILRACYACTWAWDASDGQPDGYIQTPAERYATGTKRVSV